MEIKLKAWQKFHKKMIDVTEIRFDGSGKIKSVSTYNENQCPRSITYSDINEDFRLERDGESCLKLLQYTGLKDKNGIEIYEGDLVRYKSEFTSPWDGQTRLKVDSLHNVVFHEGAFMTQPINGNSGFHELRYKADSSDGSSLELVGNIYENPELLKEE